MKCYLLAVIAVFAITLSGCSGGGGGGAPKAPDAPETATTSTQENDGGNTTDVPAAEGIEDDSTSSSSEDKTPPVITISTKVADLEKIDNRSPVLNFSANEVATFTCKLSGGTAAGTAVPCDEKVKSYSNLDPGTYTFTVEATDKAGNKGSKSITWKLAIDVETPSVNIADDSDIKTDSYKNSRAATIKFTVSKPGTTITCTLQKKAGENFVDVGNPGTLSSAQDGHFCSFSDLADSTYMATIKATRTSNAAARTGELKVIWTVDTVLPSVLVTAYPDGTINVRDFLFKFISNNGEDVIFKCKLDAGDEHNCGQNYDYSQSGQDLVHVEEEGSHTFEVYSVDKAGNTGYSEIYNEWNLEILGPFISITDRPANPNNKSTLVIPFKIENPSDVDLGTVTIDCQIKVGQAMSVPCSEPVFALHQIDPVSYTLRVETINLTDYLLTLSATSSIPNTIITQAQALWSMDQTKPEITSILAAPNSILTSNGNFVISFNEPIKRSALDGKLAVKYQSDMSSVPGSLTCVGVEIGCETFRFTLGAYIATDKTILVTLDRSGFMDLAGNELDDTAIPGVALSNNQFSWKFYTPSSGAADIAAGDSHGVVLRKNGTVLVWGKNNKGQLGVGMGVDYIATTPIMVEGLSNITAIAAGPDFTLALKDDGSVWAWGANTAGQLGNADNNRTNQFTPVPVAGVSGSTRLDNITAVAAGADFAMAIKDVAGSGVSVWAWGNSQRGRLGNGGTCSGGYCTRPVMVFMGDLTTHVPLGIGSGVAITAIAAGGEYSLALTDVGEVYAWGSNSQGQLGLGASTPAYVSYATKVGFSAQVSSIGAGVNNSFAITSGGKLFSWGSNSVGSLGDGSTTVRYAPVPINDPPYTYKISNPPIPNIQGGYDCTFALTTTGAVMAWGNNFYAGEDQGHLRLGVVSTAGTISKPAGVRGVGGTGNLVGITKLSASNNFTMALSDTGYVYVWGYNDAANGGLGLIENGAPLTHASYPRQIPGL